MKNKIFRVLIGLSILLIIGLAVWAISIQRDIEESTNIQSPLVLEEKVELTVEGLSEGPQTFKFNAKEKDTAFDLLKETGLDIDYTEYDIGIFINAIGEIENNREEGMNWMYYINEEKAGIGAGQYIVEPGDKIEWKYEKASW